MQFPECQLTHVNKNGQKKAKHNYICVGCYRQFIDCYQPHKGYSEEVKGECLKMSVNGMGFRAIERVKGVIMLCLRKSCLNFVTTLPVSTYQENYLWEIFKLVTRITKTIVRSLMSPCYNCAISTARLISMSQGIRPKLLAICDFMIVARGSVGQCLNISRLGFALQPQADCVAADIEHEQFTRGAFL